MPGFYIPTAAQIDSTHFPLAEAGNKFFNFGKSDMKFLYNYFWEVPMIFNTMAAKVDSLIYLKDVTLPSITFEKETYTAASLQYKYASGVVYDDISMTFYDTKDLLSSIIEWRSNIWTQASGLKTASEYKKNCNIFVYTPDGELCQNFKIYGSWPSSIKYGSLTYTTSDLKYVDLSITYDWMEEATDNNVA